MSAYTPFDASTYLDNEEGIVEYLQAAFEEGDTKLVILALANALRAKGLGTEILGDTTDPTLSTLLAVTKALGVKLSVAA